MLILILGVSLLVLIICLCFFYRISDECSNCGALVVGTISLIIAVVAIFAMIKPINSLVNLRYADEKIAMYEEENKVIESQIENVVNQYQDHEADIFKDCKPDEVLLIVSAYPELKADALVQKQIEVYQSNNENIKTLKLEKIQAQKSKWWLYFG